VIDEELHQEQTTKSKSKPQARKKVPIPNELGPEERAEEEYDPFADQSGMRVGKILLLI
jgi:hypothetical protein